MKPLFYLISVFLFISFSSSATQPVSVLAKHPIWLKLGHYKNQPATLSYITNASFFIADSGRGDPVTELKATIHAFNTQPSMQCRYPARYQWLKEQGLTFSMPAAECPKLQQWRDQQAIHSVSLVFASGYMSNPASLYGHLLLKLNRSTELKNKLLDYSINYGAHVPDNENGLVYILKGLFGGYKAGFSDQLFYRHQHNYGEIELRDLWEYSLNLNERDVAFIANHLWEILGTEFDYYFADENCAFHLAQIIELIIGEQLTKSSPPWVMPATIFSRLNSATYQGQSAVKKITFTPSRDTVFAKHVQSLSKKELSFAKQIFAESAVLKSDSFLALPVQSQKAIIGALFELVQVKQIQKQTPVKISELKNALIKARLKLPMGENKVKFQFTQQPPHKGQKPSNSSVSATHTPEQTQYNVGFRLSYFDSLASDIARIPFSNLEMLDTELTFVESTTYINKIHLLDLESFNPNQFSWANESKWSWKINVGFDRQPALCGTCKRSFVMGGAGQSWQLSNSTLTYSLINGYLGDLAKNSHFYDSSVEVGIITGTHSGVKLRASYEKSFLNAKHPAQTKLELAVPISQDIDIRLAVTHANSSLWQLKLNYYWQ
ncbi:DUF4105 domain-containing protein [Pseudoalteromonas prydzensis]|uniref:Lnb N-terminal periplasmic domain-containing protein n=1 Tax=Pseudoalteromonas prydzensis TaxID=182141 RepID=UPI0024BD5A60|nr:DUF4105 domain-containing protein [Pseudoalteromonas prydzensis]